MKISSNIKKFMPYIKELEVKVMILLGVFILFYCLGYFFSGQIFHIISKNKNITLVFKTLISPLLFKFNIATYFSIICTIPFLSLLILDFAFPALYKKERRILFSCVFTSIITFYFSLFAVINFIIPYIINHYNDLKIYIDINDYLNQILSLTFLLFVILMMPIIFGILLKFKIINKKKVQKYNKHAYLAIFIISAIFTPPDIIYQLVVGIIMVTLYRIMLSIF